MPHIGIYVVDVDWVNDAPSVDPHQDQHNVNNPRSRSPSHTVGHSGGRHEDIGDVMIPGNHCARCKQISHHETNIKSIGAHVMQEQLPVVGLHGLEEEVIDNPLQMVSIGEEYVEDEALWDLTEE